jgi:hypothetical protein
MPTMRKRNRYCQQIGVTSLFDVESDFSPQNLMRRLGETKYYTINTYHMQKGNRSTIEFRIGEGEGCLDPYMVKNWVRLVVHFVEMMKNRAAPGRYEPGDQWSGLCWLDPQEVMEIMGFWKPLSKGLEETRNWFLARLWSNLNTELPGVFCGAARRVAKAQVEEIISRLDLTSRLPLLLKPVDMAAALYDLDTRI